MLSVKYRLFMLSVIMPNVVILSAKYFTRLEVADINKLVYIRDELKKGLKVSFLRPFS